MALSLWCIAEYSWMIASCAGRISGGGGEQGLGWGRRCLRLCLYLRFPLRLHLLDRYISIIGCLGERRRGRIGSWLRLFLSVMCC